MPRGKSQSGNRARDEQGQFVSKSEGKSSGSRGRSSGGRKSKSR